VYVVLGVGLSAIYLGLGIFNQMADLLAARSGAHAGVPHTSTRVVDSGIRDAPLAVIFLVVEVLLSRGSISFTEPLNLVGTLTLPLLSGVLPIPLFLARRRARQTLH